MTLEVRPDARPAARARRTARGVVVGLTGMGGGALMTPMLVFFFGADPLTAISSDLVASFVMKPAGALVHLRNRTVTWGWSGCCVSAPFPPRSSGRGHQPAAAWRGAGRDTARCLLGLALLFRRAAWSRGPCSRCGRTAFRWARAPHDRRARGHPEARAHDPARVIAGFIVGITSVGSGSIIIVMLLLIYPGLKASALVGTDLTQAIPLVGAAALGASCRELLLRDHRLAAAGRGPGRLHRRPISSRAPGGVIRRALAVLLLGSGLRLLGVATEVVLFVAAVASCSGACCGSSSAGRSGAPGSRERTATAWPGARAWSCS